MESDEELKNEIAELRGHLSRHETVLTAMNEWLKRINGAVVAHTGALELIQQALETKPAVKQSRPLH